MSLKDVMVAVHAEKHLASKKKGKGPTPQASKRARKGVPPSFLKGKK